MKEAGAYIGIVTCVAALVWLITCIPVFLACNYPDKIVCRNLNGEITYQMDRVGIVFYETTYLIYNPETFRQIGSVNGLYCQTTPVK